jgi:serine acetyltransferase
MQLFAQVEGAFGTTASWSAFFLQPTVEQLATILRQGGALPETVSHPGTKYLRDTKLRGVKNRLLQILALYAPGATTVRVLLHKLRGVSIGEGTFIGTAAIIETAYPQLVSIGNNVGIGIRAVIIAHFRESTDRGKVTYKPTVQIGNDVHVGPGVIILPNVTIGDGAVVGAGSVVSQSIPPRMMVQGNPARPVARCGIPLRGNSYEDFLRQLTPFEPSPDILSGVAMAQGGGAGLTPT